MIHRISLLIALLVIVTLAGCGGGGGTLPPISTSSMVVLGYNDLGMHCMNEDFSQFMILPPYNNLHAQVIDRSGGSPRIVTDGVTVSYSVPGNTTSSNKTNFWTYAPALLGTALPADVGLTGNGLSGTISATGDNDWAATGIPITEITDAGPHNSYQLGSIVVRENGVQVAVTQAVVPVSWEISCNLCHNGSDAPSDILQAHDTLHGTNLVNQKPVLCANCHAQAPLGKVGNPSLPSLSRAMHHAHSPRMDDVSAQLGGVVCYACHPGKVTKCLRDVHFSAGMTCMDCHTSMDAVADPSRRPWVDEPRCGTPACHNVSGHTYEQANTLYKASKGHHGVHCAACHGSPHAVTPTVVDADNVQAIGIQGKAGTIDTCTVCHRSRPDDSFNHSFGGG